MAMKLRVLVIAALVGMLAALTSVAAQPLTPHFPGWERYFTVSWEPFERRGQPYLRGYIQQLRRHCDERPTPCGQPRLIRADRRPASGVVGRQQLAGIFNHLLRSPHSPAGVALSRERVRLRFRAVGAD